ncbi:hypothetical protein PIROE2DRAFT_65431 [Piromyces sp. E2]|nr:hypothetical protein PIROE2DRAFT_65431 [Piromyces sp. E2]|eukprot:OUM56639.1 hypothetical protein PIROE2DRAFT_65431 [Piromyces sp. E2]
MSSVTINSGKRSKDEASLVTSAPASNPPKVTKIKNINILFIFFTSVAGTQLTLKSNYILIMIKDYVGDFYEIHVITRKAVGASINYEIPEDTIFIKLSWSNMFDNHLFLHYCSSGSGSDVGFNISDIFVLNNNEKNSYYFLDKENHEIDWDGAFDPSNQY